MELISEYINATHLVAHQIDSFNHFITNGIQSIVNRESTIDCSPITIKFGHVYVDTPKFIHSDRRIGLLYPNDARKKNITYDGVCYVNTTIVNSETNFTKQYNRIAIGRIPIMLHSNACNLNEQNGTVHEECSNDHGGYFIIKGKERVLIGQLRPVYNKVFVYQSKPEEKYTYFSEIRSMNDQGGSVLIQAKIDRRNNLWFSLPYIKILLPAGIVFRALGCCSCVDDLRKYIASDDEAIMENIAHQFNDKKSKEEALEFIASGVSFDKDSSNQTPLEYVQTILNNEIFYHVGGLSAEKSAIHLGYLLKQLISVATGNACVDDKSNLANKRIDTVSSLLSFLVQGLFKQFVKTIATQMKSKKNPDPLIIINSLNVITFGLNSCFMTGNWATQKSSSTYTRVGVSQVLSVQNYGARISHLRRIMLPNGTKGKNSKARQLHSSQFSYLCPYETPEGETVGLVGNLALTTETSIGIPSCEIFTIVKRFKSYRPFKSIRDTVLLLNGVVVGSADKALDFKREFEQYRCSDMIDSSVSFVWLRYSNEIHILSDHGRLLRPLFRVGDGNRLLYEKSTSWKSAIASSTIVFRDPFELEQAVVAIDESDLKRNRCEYMEICPAGTMMGIMASVIPFSNHSQSPRNAYQSSMGKQAIGIPCESFRYRYDTTLHVLDYAQTPLTRSEMVNVVKFNEMSHGAVPIVAIMTHCGFNQEDSIILNKASIDRGLFSLHTYKTIVELDRKRGNSDFENICAPKYTYRKREYNYSYINEQDGIVEMKPNLWLKQNDVVIGKTTNRMVKKELVNGTVVRELETKDASVVIKHGEEGYLDSVVDTMNNEGVRVIKIRIRINHRPEIGDKFASSTAQKGTCGMIYSQEDMPFDKDGIVPDLIMNPHAIPSRMTINMLIEMCLNLVGCKTGKMKDATSFAHSDIEGELDGYLKELGWTSYATQLYSGFTGERFQSKMFMAPAFYQCLKHMVDAKMHTRVAGPLDTLTHQPVAGRSRDGGLRFGEMERDALIAHGSSRMLKECLYDQSDKYQVSVCNNCGRIPHTASKCHVCDDKDTDIGLKVMPYATKLLYQELMGMGIKIAFT